jgi:hypothetical protein
MAKTQGVLGTESTTWPRRSRYWIPMPGYGVAIPIDQQIEARRIGLHVPGQ